MAFLDFDTQTAANPWTTYPTGWQRTSPYLVQISTQSGVEYFARSSGTTGQCACLVNTTPITGNTLVVKRVHGTNATTSGTTAQCVMHNASGNGYVLEQDQAGTTTTFKLMIAWVIQATALQTFTSYGTGYSQQFELWCIDKAAGTFQFKRNGVQVGSNFTDTTYTGLEYGGVGGTGGRTRSIDVGELFDVLTLTSPIVAGQPFSGTCVGSSDGAGTLTAGGLAVPMTVAGGGTTFSGTWPLPADDTLYPVMNSVSINFTWTRGANSEVLARPFNAPAGTAVTQFGIVIDTGPIYLGYPFDQAGNPLLTGEYVYAKLPSPAVIDPDSRVRDFDPGDLPYETTLVIHRTNGKTYLHDMTFTASGVGPTPSEGGLTSTGLTSVAPTSTGLTSVGL